LGLRIVPILVKSRNPQEVQDFVLKALGLRGQALVKRERDFATKMRDAWE
jgi:hypothetical protein